MKFRVVSDLHLEFRHDYLNRYTLPSLPEDKETMLLLAGDIGLLGEPRTYRDFMIHSSKQFKGIFWIAGNHCYYHSNIDMRNVKMAIDDLALPNIYTDLHILKEEKIAIIGDTLWTDFEREDPASIFIANRGMNDFNNIATGNGVRSQHSTLRAERTILFHKEQKQRIFGNVKHYSNAGFNCVVVSHHQPSRKGIGEGYLGSPLNGAFVSDLDEEIKQYPIKYWIAGHTHTANKYMIGETKVITNPLGYPSETDTYFDPILTIEI